MEQKKSVVYIIVKKILCILGLLLLVVPTVFSETVEKEKEQFPVNKFPIDCIVNRQEYALADSLFEKKNIDVTNQDVFTPFLGIKSNLFYWIGLMPDFKHYNWTPNLSVEGYFANRWSVNLTGAYAERKVGKDKHFGVSAVSLEPRFWLDGSGSYRWLYAGLYGELGEFDNQRIHISDNRTGEFAGAGISVGVYIPFCDHIGAEIGLRGGYSRRTVDYYSIENRHDYFDFSKKENKWGITGINISIVCRLGK